MKLPSVTQLINLLPEFAFNSDKIDQITLDNAIVRGKCVHSLMECYIKDLELECNHNSIEHIDLTSIVIEELLRLEKELKIVSTYSEIPIKGKEYTGIVDIIMVDINDNAYLVDIKTTSGKNKDKEQLQLYMYSKLVDNDDILEVKVKGVYVINPRLKTKSKHYKLDIVNDKKILDNYVKRAINEWKNLTNKIY